MATTATIAGDAAKIAGAIQTAIVQGSTNVDVTKMLGDLAGAVLALSEICINNAATLSTATNPITIAISNKYLNANYGGSSPLQTTP